MSNQKKKKQTLKTMAVKVGCGSCSTLSLNSIFNPKPRKHHHYSDPSTSTKATRAPASSPFTAMEKDSAEPYLDFRASMLQMIVENEIYTKEDLRNLLTCFLQLNAPPLHAVIITAFTDIWNSILFSSTPNSTPHLNVAVNRDPPPPRRHRRRRRRNPNDHCCCPPKPYPTPKSYQM